LPFTQIPHTSRLFADYLYHFDRVQDFYPHSPLSRDWAAVQAQSVTMDPARRARVAAILERQNRAWGASEAALSNIERLRGGAAAILTGQQVGLFGGPAYSLYKALSAVKVAQEFIQAGVDAVPVFWLATEDHDFAEIATAVLPGASGELQRITVESSSARPDVPVGSIVLGEQVAAAVRQARETLGDSTAADLLEQCYTPDATWGSAFARLFCRVFSRLGLVVIDPSDPELHEVAAPIFQGTVEQVAELNRVVVDRGKALVKAGYHEQVKVTAASTFLFRMVNGERVALRRVNGGFAAGEEKFSPADLARRAAEAPQEFSASVLLRPVVQDFLLPTVAVVGGPAEIAYYAQSGPLFEGLLGRVTPILPRFSATLVDQREARLLDKYRVSVADLVRCGSIAELLASRALPPQLEQQFSAAAQSMSKTLTEITASLDQLDHTLVDAAQRSGAKMRYQLERLHGRAARSLLRRSEIIARHAAQLTAVLYPDGALQERVTGGIHFLARYGTELLDTLQPAVETSCPDHKVIRL
jgi:bacillithiol biosynthesis cysteine-adding enzyme BshC